MTRDETKQVMEWVCQELAEKFESTATKRKSSASYFRAKVARQESAAVFRAMAEKARMDVDVLICGGGDRVAIQRLMNEALRHEITADKIQKGQA